MIISENYKISEVELIYRNKVKAKDRPRIQRSCDAYELLCQSWDMNKMDLQEQFKVLLLDKGGHCMGIMLVSSGGMSACLVDPKLVFATALKARACSLILAHNHPSGNLKASKEDEALTEQLCEGGGLLHIDILDHLILTSDGYTSLADDGNACLSRKKSYALTR
jgi:DNA repair protein RadC